MLQNLKENSPKWIQLGQPKYLHLLVFGCKHHVRFQSPSPHQRREDSPRVCVQGLDDFSQKLPKGASCFYSHSSLFICVSFFGIGNRGISHPCTIVVCFVAVFQTFFVAYAVSSDDIIELCPIYFSEII